MKANWLVALLSILPVCGFAKPVEWQLLPWGTSDDLQGPIHWHALPPAEVPSQGPAWTDLTSKTDSAKLQPIFWERLPANTPDQSYTPLKLAQPSTRLVPSVQTLNRSIAFNDLTPGPDVAWKVPQGFRWSENWFLDSSIFGANIRPNSSNFWAWNNGDAAAEIHARVFQGNKWTFGINASIRSVYQGNQFGGGTTKIGDGFSTGFRIDYALSSSSGIAIGGEQLIQYDSNNDTGRNIYLVASKGWWLGNRAGNFPLAIGTIGIGTGRLGDNPSYQFACSEFLDAAIDVNKRYPICFSPIVSAAILINENFSLFSEYNSQDILAGISSNINNSFPVRLTWGVLLANKGSEYRFAGSDALRWFFRASVGL
jgi:hypothetical protein